MSARLGRSTAVARVAGGAVIGLGVGLGAGVVGPWQVAVLTGWNVAALVFLVSVWLGVHHLGCDEVRLVATHEDPNRALADLLLLAASVGCLVGVGLALVKASQTGGGAEAALVGLCLGSVVASWLVVQTVFTLHYARLYYAGLEGGIDFNDQSAPDFTDFAYLAFTVGMTYQVSDTDITSPAIRRVVLRHALLSFLFGTFIVAMTINVVAGLLR